MDFHSVMKALRGTIEDTDDRGRGSSIRSSDVDDDDSDNSSSNDQLISNALQYYYFIIIDTAGGIKAFRMK